MKSVLITEDVELVLTSNSRYFHTLVVYDSSIHSAMSNSLVWPLGIYAFLAREAENPNLILEPKVSRPCSFGTWTAGFWHCIKTRTERVVTHN